ncbi:MAG: AbrB/MazE/SpoVT family DNA-binding domain-containing protein [Candidatus Hydrogenedentes bacterium]|nr:AbrB/MazE/SpoVT family DNA-binding domain-containing protein [Candidatus Hydrogenedentota bacterium]
MRVRLTEQGDGLTFTIPSELVADLRLAKGTVVDVSEAGGKLIVKPIEEDRPTIDELIEMITDENRHEETDWGPPVGKEIW